MRRQIRKLNDESGVTLVELLAAIAILSIVVTAFLGFFIQAAKTNQYTNQVNEATFIAQEQMEEIIHEPPAPPEKAEGSIETKITETGYEIKTKIKMSEITGLYNVTVTVRDKPEDKGGKVRATMQNILPLETKKAESEITE